MKRILIAGHEIGGQMQMLAEAFRKKGHVAHSVAFNSDFRQYQNDFNIKSRKMPIRRFFFALRSIFRYDTFHFFWGISLLDFWIFTGLDLPLLKLLGKKIVVHFRGTDLVDINYYSYLNAKARGENIPEPPKSRSDQLNRLAQWRKYADHLLVSTPDLLEIVPEAKLVPQVLNVEEFEKYVNENSNKVFRLGHAPTRRNTKGTELIITAVKNLQLEGHSIELDLIEGVTPENVFLRFSQCDAGIDQLLLGWYGKVSIELMAMGKPVLCFIDKKFLNVMPSIPIINVDKQNLSQQLVSLITWRNVDREKLRTFVIKNHNVDTVADELLKMYNSK